MRSPSCRKLFALLLCVVVLKSQPKLNARLGVASFDPPLPHTLTHTHTHWGGAEGHRTEHGCFCSEDNAGCWMVGCVRQHEHTLATLGSGFGFWPEREEQSVVDSVRVGLQARVLCKITWFGLALHVHVGQ